MDAERLRQYFDRIAARMAEKEDYLIRLDQQNGDGDLGLSMKEGFAAASAYLRDCGEEDLGRLMMGAAKALNGASPSTLGTILSLGMMGMAKALKGKKSADTRETAEAMRMGLANIEAKAGSREGEKTILDALYPAVRALSENQADSVNARQAAARAAAEGSEKTKSMRAVHGRAAYYGDKSIGMLDGGSAAGRLIFEAIAEV
jgi:dihydroxyacetone kinase-like protein